MGSRDFSAHGNDHPAGVPDVPTGETLNDRSREGAIQCSTLKDPLWGAVLARAGEGHECDNCGWQVEPADACGTDEGKEGKTYGGSYLHSLFSASGNEKE